MVFFVFTREKRIADVQLVEDAAKAPHVDGLRVLDTQDDLWCSVEPGLDIGVYFLILKATTSKINNLDSTLVYLSEQNILWLKVTMNDAMLV